MCVYRRKKGSEKKETVTDSVIKIGIEIVVNAETEVNATGVNAGGEVKVHRMNSLGSLR